jgi:hypothetical protein
MGHSDTWRVAPRCGSALALPSSASHCDKHWHAARYAATQHYWRRCFQPTRYVRRHGCRMKSVPHDRWKAGMCIVPYIFRPRQVCSESGSPVYWRRLSGPRVMPQCSRIRSCRLTALQRPRMSSFDNPLSRISSSAAACALTLRSVQRSLPACLHTGARRHITHVADGR